MISEELREAINTQLNFELESGYIYKGMEAYFGGLGLTGFQRFMKLQAEEEYDHHDRFVNFLNEAGFEVEYDELPKPKHHYSSPVEAFRAAYAHEQEVTRRINKLYEIALENKDYSAVPTLHWFIDEQVEEEDTFRGILDTFEFAQDNPVIIYQLNIKLGQRQE